MQALLPAALLLPALLPWTLQPLSTAAGSEGPGPTVFGAQTSPVETPAAEEIVLGTEGHRYRWVPDWLQLPEGMTLGNTHGCVAVDSKGRIFFNADAKHAVVVVAPDGKVESTWGEEWAGGLHGMAIVQEKDGEFCYLAHTGRHEVAKATLDGKVLWTIPYPEASGLYKDKNQYKPTAIAVASDGRIFVGDGYGQSYVHLYSKDREYIRSIGGGGTEPGKMRTPHGLVIETLADGKEVLVVCDRENGRLQRFDLDGTLLRAETPGLRRPCSGVFTGDVLAIADLMGRVTVLGLDKAGERYVVAHLGDNPDPARRGVNGVERENWADGAFLSPHGVGADAAGNLYVLDWNRHGRVSKLERLKD